MLRAIYCRRVSAGGRRVVLFWSRPIVGATVIIRDGVCHALCLCPPLLSSSKVVSSAARAPLACLYPELKCFSCHCGLQMFKLKLGELLAVLRVGTFLTYAVF